MIARASGINPSMPKRRVPYLSTRTPPPTLCDRDHAEQPNGARARHTSHFVEADADDISKIVGEPADHVFLANAFHGIPDRPLCLAPFLKF